MYPFTSISKNKSFIKEMQHKCFINKTQDFVEYLNFINKWQVDFEFKGLTVTKNYALNMPFIDRSRLTPEHIPLLRFLNPLFICFWFL